MIEAWKHNFTSDCTVVELQKNYFVYCIFKNARSSLLATSHHAGKILFKNNQIKELNKINVFLREPEDRFVSGVYTFMYLNNIKTPTRSIEDSLKTNKLTDKHVMPQYFWLIHLLRYYKGDITISPMKELYPKLTSHYGPWTDNARPWKPISSTIRKKLLSMATGFYIDADKILLKNYLGKTINLKRLIKEIRNDLPSY